MKVDILLGLQWGDEGKGKIVDFIGKKYNLIGRFKVDRMLAILSNLIIKLMSYTLFPQVFFKKKLRILLETVLLLIQLFSLMNYQI